MPRPPKYPPHMHAYDADEGGKCVICKRSPKQVASLEMGRAKLAEKLAIERARKNGVDVLTGNEPPVPDTGALGPKIVDTPYQEPARKAPPKDPSNPDDAGDQTETSPVQSSDSNAGAGGTGHVQTEHRSTGRSGGGLGRVLRTALGLEED